MSSGPAELNPDTPLPALRAIDIFPIENDDGQPHFVLQDRTQIARQTVTVSGAGYFVLAHLDGRHTCADVQTGFLRQFGMRLNADQIHGLVRSLDEALLLQTDRFEQVYARCQADYAASATRDNRARYPDSDVLKAELESILASGVAAPVKDIRGVIAPHLDYERGAPCYADAYATLARAKPAERYIILGANHAGRSESVVATATNFETPLGRVPVDAEFVSALESRWGHSLREHELDHAWEHSVELQVHFLQVLLADRPFNIVPLLCPSPPGIDDETTDGRETELEHFANVLAGLLDEGNQRTILIAGADLSHIGRQFGDEEPTTTARMAAVGDSDREALELLTARAEDTFVERLRAAGNPTRICSAGCIYTLLRTLPQRPCHLLSYHQAVNIEAEMSVTCAALVVG